MSLLHRPWKCTFVTTFLLLMVFALGSWVNAQPRVYEPIPDFVEWASAKAPADSEILLVMDGEPSPSEPISARELARINHSLAVLSKYVPCLVLPEGGLKATDLDWLGGQMALFGSFVPAEKKFSGALLLSVRDSKRAQEVVGSISVPMASRFEDGWVCLATSEECLKRALDGTKPSLAQESRFVAARSRLTHSHHALVYMDLVKLVPRALDMLKSAEQGKESVLSQFDLSSVEALLASLQCLIGGEDIVDNNVLADLYLLADVENSGSLGRLLFDEQANIAHPAFMERSAKSQFCYASNIQYDYKIIYNLLGIHPITAFFRSYPEMLLAGKGISLQKDIIEGTLNGSMVSSVENLDTEQVMMVLKDILGEISTAPSEVQPEKSTSGSAKCDNAKSGSAKCDNAKSGSAKCDNAKSGSAKCDNAKSGSAKCDNAKSGSAKCDNAKSGSAKCDNAKSGSAKCDNAKSGSAKCENAKCDNAKSEGSQSGKSASDVTIARALKAWDQSDWRVSLDLRPGSLEKLASKDDSIRELLQEALSTSESKPEEKSALAQRLPFLPAMRVLNNTLWIAGSRENCAPPAKGVATLGQLPAWKYLNAMCGTERCAAQWAVDNGSFAQALVECFGISEGGALVKAIASERGTWQCGRAITVPGGLRVCEIVELSKKAKVR